MSVVEDLPFSTSGKIGSTIKVEASLNCKSKQDVKETGVN